MTTDASKLLEQLDLAEENMDEETDLRAAADKMVAYIKKRASNPEGLPSGLANKFFNNMKKMVDGELGN